ncbi:MAG: YbjN domain-containing protein [Miltoncostaeaceae bacterium]
MTDGAALVQVWLDGIGVDAERLGAREWSIRVPSVKRGIVAVAAEAGERTLALRAFFMRGPDRAHSDVYRRALRKNLDMHHWRFAVDDAGDLWLLAEAETSVLGSDGLDGLLGLLSTYVDESFEGILRLGFEVPPGQGVSPLPTATGYTRFDPRQRANS